MKKSMMILAFVLALFGSTQSLATPVTFYATLNGTSEEPQNASPATGFATVIFDLVAHTMEVDVSFSGLLGLTTTSHIHCCTAIANAGTVGVATTIPSFTGFPAGVTSGTYIHVFDMSLASSYNAAFITANGGTTINAEAALFAGMLNEEAYFNIHTSAFPGGEIRGFLVQNSVPEPGSLALLGLALAGVGFTRRRIARRQKT